MSGFVSVSMWLGLIAFATSAVTAILLRSRVERRQLTRNVILAASAFTLVPVVSVVNVVVTDDDSLVPSLANWARNHTLGFAVDRLELLMYSDPPSTVPAQSLSLAFDPSATTLASLVASTSIPTMPRNDVETDDVDDSRPTTTSTTSTTEPPKRFSPDAIATVVDPPLDGEGQWIAVDSISERAHLWATSFRPLAEFPSVTATVIVIDPAGVRYVLHNGSELPGGSWEAGPRLDFEQQPVAAFNGGFRFEHIDGGYRTEGVTVQPLVDGEATLAISRVGAIKVGVWGRDLDESGDWISVRQSLPPIVDGGVNNVVRRNEVWWGADFDDVTYVFRSAICQGPSDELFYVSAGLVDASLMAEVMIAVGCEVAMQLDINGDWPQFAVVIEGEDGEPEVVLADSRMGTRGRYINGSKKDFVGIYLDE